MVVLHREEQRQAELSANGKAKTLTKISRDRGATCTLLLALPAKRASFLFPFPSSFFDATCHIRANRAKRRILFIYIARVSRNIKKGQLRLKGGCHDAVALIIT